MSIVVTCKCGKILRVKDEYAGKKGKCPACGHNVLVPKTSDAVAVKSVRSPTPPKKDQCSECGAEVEPENGAIGKDGPIICSQCVDGAQNVAGGVAKSRFRNPLLLGGVASAVLVLAAAGYFLSIGDGAAKFIARAQGQAEYYSVSGDTLTIRHPSVGEVKLKEDPPAGDVRTAEGSISFNQNGEHTVQYSYERGWGIVSLKLDGHKLSPLETPESATGLAKGGVAIFPDGRRRAFTDIMSRHLEFRNDRSGNMTWLFTNQKTFLISEMVLKKGITSAKAIRNQDDYAVDKKLLGGRDQIAKFVIGPLQALNSDDMVRVGASRQFCEMTFTFVDGHSDAFIAFATSFLVKWKDDPTKWDTLEGLQNLAGMTFGPAE